ncbi:uncharacterized protein LOC124678515 [Lolium rigidum]|uniref:uncharacterized protein LOC124678515 n=1 Tax=Lolium rigidum TaxID=89674 RepID=UPI001F5CC344|nr:uncharacterized protein LOC124678515 [Lolium rigidum]XP_047070344.1 uncharacterized protein LOC124678515 [Lolium rigidum]
MDNLKHEVTRMDTLAHITFKGLFKLLECFVYICSLIWYLLILVLQCDSTNAMVLQYKWTCPAICCGDQEPHSSAFPVGVCLPISSGWRGFLSVSILRTFKINLKEHCVGRVWLP